jgi:hypothetical protein
MTTTDRYRYLPFLYLCSLLAAAPLFAADFTLGMRGESIVAQHATPDGDVAFFSETVSATTYRPAYYHAALAMPSDGTGEATYSTSHAKDKTAVWVAVDVQSGAVATVSGDGTTPVPFPLADSMQVRDTSGSIAKLQLPFIVGDLLIVRPGEGAWHATGMDGGPADDDHARNGRLSFSLDTLVSFKNKNNSKPPHALKKGDVIVAIEARTLRYAVLRVKE